MELFIHHDLLTFKKILYQTKDNNIILSVQLTSNRQVLKVTLLFKLQANANIVLFAVSIILYR